MRRGITLVALLLVVVAPPTAALACRCRGPRPGPAALRRADVAFRGRVLEVRHGLPRAPHFVTSATFKVLEVFKGELPRRLEVDTGDTSCGLRTLRVGEQWVVFARRDEDGRLHTRQCTGTRRIARPGRRPSAAMLRRLTTLGPGRPVQPR